MKPLLAGPVSAGSVVTSWLFNILRIAILIVIGARSIGGTRAQRVSFLCGLADVHRPSRSALSIVAHRCALAAPCPSLRVSDLPRLAEETHGCPDCAVHRHDDLRCRWPPPSGPHPSDAYPFRAVVMMAAALLYFRPALLQPTAPPRSFHGGGDLHRFRSWHALLTDHRTSRQCRKHPSAPSVASGSPSVCLARSPLVPLIEELVLSAATCSAALCADGLILDRLLAHRCCPSLLFGLLHERLSRRHVWQALVFGVLFLQRNPVLQIAIAAHVVANALNAVAALITGIWARI